jgi:hypothetical protein
MLSYYGILIMLAEIVLLYYSTLEAYICHESLLAVRHALSYNVAMAKAPSDRAGAPETQTTVLYIRDTPGSLARKLRAAAALAGYRGIPDYVIEILTKHTEELERKGLLPKQK